MSQYDRVFGGWLPEDEFPNPRSFMSEQPKSSAPREARDDEVSTTTGNVFADLGLPNPEERMVKAELARQIAALTKGKRQSEIAELIGTHQSDVSDILRGKLRDFSVQWLEERLTRLGVAPPVVLRCTCAATPPTMPTFRSTHLAECPLSLLEILARLRASSTGADEGEERKILLRVVEWAGTHTVHESSPIIDDIARARRILSFPAPLPEGTTT